MDDNGKLRADLEKYKKLYETYSDPQRKYREKHREYYREKAKEWRQNNPDRYKETLRAYRLRKKQASEQN